MDRELRAAAEFLARAVPAAAIAASAAADSHHLSERRAEFLLTCVSTLARRCSASWDPRSPYKGSAARSIAVIDGRPDTTLREIALSAGIASIASHFPTDFVMWIDPHSVSYRVGDHGQVITIYEDRAALDALAARGSLPPFHNRTSLQSSVKDGRIAEYYSYRAESDVLGSLLMTVHPVPRQSHHLPSSATTLNPYSVYGHGSTRQQQHLHVQQPPHLVIRQTTHAYPQTSSAVALASPPQLVPASVYTGRSAMSSSSSSSSSQSAFRPTSPPRSGIVTHQQAAAAALTPQQQQELQRAMAAILQPAAVQALQALPTPPSSPKTSAPSLLASGLRRAAAVERSQSPSRVASPQKSAVAA